MNGTARARRTRERLAPVPLGALASFDPSPYPIGFDNVQGCLEQIDQVCLEDARRAAAPAGTLMLDDLVLR